MTRNDLCSTLLALLLAVTWLAPLRADRSDWVEGGPRGQDGATRDYYNRAGRLGWKNFLGDWRDARGVEQGDEPYATARVTRDGEGAPVEWDVTTLVREWVRGTSPNKGFFLRRVEGDAECHFASRESPNESARPRLVITTEKGKRVLAPEADTYLEPSTYRGQGRQETLRVGGRNHALLRFSLEALSRDLAIEKARLRLEARKMYGGGPAWIGVFRSSQGHERPGLKVEKGLAARYPRDRGIEKDPAVIFFGGFESPEWEEGWTHVAPRPALETVSTDPDRGFETLDGAALRVKMAEGKNTALNTLFKFQEETGQEPEDIYFRYYLRLADDWNQTVQGGKMPGISGTYGVAGWGGRPSDGRNGWSARGAFHKTIPDDNPLRGLHPIGTYCYHADMKGQYGNIWLWQEDYLGFLENNRWYCVEQFLRLNDPGEKNGIIRAWIDGRLAFEKESIRFRLVERLKIEQVWMNVYHGGKLPSPHDQHLYIDNVVIAREYIGPMTLSDS